ncbi:transcription factor HES-4-like [Paramacrobiotus metropolitanus]|uniref:transcription factor HES-4-like n=1 Tax=Paramacrobiotus metropolitanus TaxID=2943436 RepID=UPI002446361C|nr:transcription factor HES-4-like [Paramacrobiotus metropolitanus]
MPVERSCISSGMSEHRRASKPIMEKRRRARINNSLSELKSLILDATRKDCSRHSKLEKADILEMTVKHLQALQRQQMAAAVATDPTVLNKFKAGFSECASEISRYLNAIDGVDKIVRQRILSHLGSCLNGLHNYLTPIAFPSVYQPGLTVPAYFPPVPTVHLPSPHPMLPKDSINLRSVPGTVPPALISQRDFSMSSLRPHQHFFPPCVSPLTAVPLSDHNSCSSPSHSISPTSPQSTISSCAPGTPTTPLSPPALCSKLNDLSDPVWRPW